MSMATIHISEAEAIRDFAGLLARVHLGAEIVIESSTYPAAVLRAAVPSRRSISECITLAKKHEKSRAWLQCLTRTSPPMWRRSSVIASPPIRPRGSDPVGLILDSSVVIAAERRSHTVRQILEQIQASCGETDVGLSVVTIAELMHGCIAPGPMRINSGGRPLSSGCRAMCPSIRSPSR